MKLGPATSWERDAIHKSIQKLLYVNLCQWLPEWHAAKAQASPLRTVKFATFHADWAWTNRPLEFWKQHPME